MQRHLPCLLLLRSLGHGVTRVGPQWPLEVTGLRHRESAFFWGGILQLLLGSQGTQQQQQQLFLHKQGCFSPHRLLCGFLGGPP